MKCPFCKNEETKVVDSRVAQDGLSIRRRRECESCASRFSTYEQMEILELYVKKRDGSTQSYSREKLESGLLKAVEKDASSSDDFRELVTEIEQEIYKKAVRGEIESKEIGSIVVKKLKKYDPIAYLRFASVYRNFDNIKQFKKELQKL